MHSFAALSAPAVVKAFDLSSATSLLDLGGATGAIARAACESYPGLCTAVVVDLPHVVVDAEVHFAPSPGGPCDGRLRWLAADLFTEQDKLPHQVRGCDDGSRQPTSWEVRESRLFINHQYIWIRA